MEPTLIMTLRNGKEIEIPASARETQQRVNGTKIKGFRLKGGIEQILLPIQQAQPRQPRSLQLKGIPGVKEATDKIYELETVAEIEEYTMGDERKTILRAVRSRVEEINNQ